MRGLKYEEVADVIICIESHPTMGAWIEIVFILLLFFGNVSHPTMGAWIEIPFL